jgi:hypothetical protein
VLLTNLLLRVPQIGLWYTDDGVLPRAALVELRDPALNLHLISGTWAVQFALMMIAIVFAVCLVIGYRTRLATLVSWALYTSLLARNPLIGSGGEQVLRLLLFWSIFLPLDSDDEDPHLSLAGVAFIAQVCAIYLFALVEKMDPIWLTERSAVYYSLHLDSFVTRLGAELRDMPALTRTFTAGTLALELVGPLLAVSPVLTRPFRLFVPILFIGFHLGLGLTMRLGLFPWVCAAMWLALLPGRWRVPHVGRSSGHLGAAGSLVVVAVLMVAALQLLAPVSRPIDPGDESMGTRWLSLTAGYQRWAMFAPHPQPVDGWHIIEGRRDGEKVNLWGTTETKPALVSSTYPDSRWLAYLFRLGGWRYKPYRRYFADHLCRKEQLDSLRIAAMIEWTPPPGKPVPPPRRNVIWEGECP